MTDQPTYIEQVADQIGDRVPDCPRDLLLFYALLALTTGVVTTRENVHDAWAAWRVWTYANHPALVPYDDLDLGWQMLDEPYAEAIRQVAGDREKVAATQAPHSDADYPAGVQCRCAKLPAPYGHPCIHTQEAPRASD